MVDAINAKTFDPFPKLTEFEANNLAQSPRSSSPAKKEVDDVLSSPIIKKFDSDNLAMPAMKLEDDSVLIEWQPHSEKAMASKDKVFVKWTANHQHGQNEDLKDLEKDYLNISKLK